MFHTQFEKNLLKSVNMHVRWL